jgi:hypothetical protein
MEATDHRPIAPDPDHAGAGIRLPADSAFCLIVTYAYVAHLFLLLERVGFLLWIIAVV